MNPRLRILLLHLLHNLHHLHNLPLHLLHNLLQRLRYNLLPFRHSHLGLHNLLLQFLLNMCPRNNCLPSQPQPASNTGHPHSTNHPSYQLTCTGHTLSKDIPKGQCNSPPLLSSAEWVCLSRPPWHRLSGRPLLNPFGVSGEDAERFLLRCHSQ